MRSLLLLMALSVTPIAAHAECKVRCKEKARACKDQCKLDLPHISDARHRCLKSCEVNEHECKAKCP